MLSLILLTPLALSMWAGFVWWYRYLDGLDVLADVRATAAGVAAIEVTSPDLRDRRPMRPSARRGRPAYPWRTR